MEGSEKEKIFFTKAYLLKTPSCSFIIYRIFPAYSQAIIRRPIVYQDTLPILKGLILYGVLTI